MKLDPSQIHQVLKQATPASGSLGNSLGKRNEDKSAFKDLLELNGLSETDVLESIGSVMRGGETDQVRLRAAELGAKLHGFMQPDLAAVPQITIIIKDAQAASINSILLPR